MPRPKRAKTLDAIDGIGSGFMKVGILRITIDRSTGRELDRKIIGYEEIDEDAYYRPLVEMFGKRVLAAMEEGRWINERPMESDF